MSHTIRNATPEELLDLGEADEARQVHEGERSERRIWGIRSIRGQRSLPLGAPQVSRPRSLEGCHVLLRRSGEHLVDVGLMLLERLDECRAL